MSRFIPQYSQTALRLNDAGDDVWQVHNQALKRQSAGEDIIVLSVGDHDLPTIERIIEQAVTSLYRGRTHYSPGMGELHLRKKIAEIETSASGKETSVDEIIIFPGATNALYTVLSCLLGPGDTLVTTEPGYIGYQGIFHAIGHNVVSVPTRTESGFALDTRAVRDAITPETRVLLLNTPGNPSGNVINEEDLRELADFTLERNIWLVCDEVYSMLTFDKPHASARKAARDLDNVIIVDGLSKSHAMTGWRLGWAVAPVHAIEPLLNFTSATVFGCSQFIQDAAAFALENDAEYIGSIVKAYRGRRDHAVERLNSIEGISCRPPEAGMFLMVDVSKVSEDGDNFARDLLDQAGVSVLPGRGFGELTAGYVRLSLTHEIDILSDAFDRIRRFIDR
jgi:arginine:pyruvate transaminase